MEGNSFSLVSEKLGRTLGQAMQGVLASQAGQLGSQADNLRKMLATNQSASVLSVGVVGPEGWETIANGNKSISAMAVPVAAGVGGMVAAIAIPNFIRAQSAAQPGNNPRVGGRGQASLCINNLRLIDSAKQQWALENNKKSTDTPTMEDLKPYLAGPNGNFPKCPDGGEYILGSVGEMPRCTIPGHVLP
jgi:hypothetical protein